MATMQDELTPSSASGAVGSGTVQQSSPGYQTVDQAYNQLVSQDSPMMQQAAATGQRQAARRGLGNSSMAAGMAQVAQATVAVPLAQQMASQSQNQSQYDRSQTETEREAQVGEGFTQQQITNQAEQYARSQTEAERAALAGEGFTQQQISNQAQQFGQSLAEQQRAAQAQEGLSQQQITNQEKQFGQSLEEQKRASQVSEQQGQQQINNQASQFTQSLSQQQKESAQQNQQFQQNLDLQNRQLREQSEQFAQSIQANVRGSYTDAAQNILNNSSVNINNIASNASLKQQDKDKLIQQELNNRNNDLAQLQSMYSGVQGWADRL